MVEEHTDGGDNGGDDSDGDLEVSPLSNSDDSVLDAITKRYPQMKMKRNRFSKVSHYKGISQSRS